MCWRGWRRPSSCCAPIQATGPDFFEVLLAAALMIFHEDRVDVAIIEAGIGARGDATACVDPMLSILTTIEAEHLDIIGPTLADVAREKAAVASPGAPLVAGKLDSSLRRIVESTARDKRAPTAIAGRDFVLETRAPSDNAEMEYREAGYRLRFAAPHLAWLPDCAALAVAAARRLPGFDVSDEAIRRGLAEVDLPGRLEIVCEQPLVIADGAHTEASTERLATMLTAQPAEPKVLVVSCSTGHDPAEWSPKLWAAADAVIAICAEPPAAVPRATRPA
jgi:dihydrofolate synthase/folylpolyglutamate synthase